jgi:hypothetical protein
MVRMPYSLENLGPHEFERLVQTLLIRIYSPAVRVFGTGRDDGRDATFHGDGSLIEGVPDWNGYHVFQAKYRERPTTTDADKRWLLKQVTAELKAWSNTHEVGRERRKGPRPEFFVFVSNVFLSGQVGGGRDEIEKHIKDHTADPKNEWPLKDCAVWDGTTIERFLDAYPEVRQAFNGLITPGDVLAALAAGRMTVPTISLDETVPILEEHARTELVSHGKVALGEAGDLSNQRLDLADVAVDLPARWESDPEQAPTVRVLANLIATGNQSLRPSVLPHDGPSPHVLLMGGPGQGKTTLGRILVQTYRAELLAQRPRLSADVSRAVAATTARAHQIGLPPVKNKRWPFRIDLAKYADLVQGGASIPITKYIADQINAEAGGTFTIVDARKWLTAWPWLLVLDGYDEVAAPAARAEVARAVSGLLEAGQSCDADLLVVATTRPQGYGDELPTALRQQRLTPLPPDVAIQYATTLTNLRMGPDPLKKEVLERIEAAAVNDVTERLMRTPLQVMILSLLLEKRRKPPQDRAALFSDYYDVIYDREVNKQGFLSDVLDDYRPDVDAIHHSVGLTLQKRSESAGDAEALMPLAELHKIIRRRLVDQGHEGRRLDRLVADLGQAARDRLVLLAAKGKDQVGFDLRSLQEYMAARSLTNGSDGAVLDNLKVIAPAAHWRNTWLLAVGTVYRHRSHLFPGVLQLMRDIDADDPLSLVAATGPRLALDILDDGVARHSPRHVSLLVRHVLELLNGAAMGGSRLGDVLADQDLNETSRSEVIQALRRALADTPSSRFTAIQVLVELILPDRLGPERTGPLALKARQLYSTLPTPAPPGKVEIKHQSLAQALPATTNTWRKGTPLGDFKADLRRIKVVTGGRGIYTPPDHAETVDKTIEIVKDHDALFSVVEAIEEIDPDNTDARAAVTSLLFSARQRIPVAAALRGQELSTDDH